MIDLQHDHLVIACDRCGATYEGDKDCELDVLWETAKDEGWRDYKAGEWPMHACPKCGAPT